MGATTLYNFRTKVVDVTLTNATANYAVGDVLVETQEISLGEGGSATRPLRGTINNLMLIDKNDIGPQCDILFLSSNVSIGSADGAVSLSAANSENLLGRVDTGATWVDLINTKVVTPSAFSPIPFELSGDSLYVGVVARAAYDTSSSGTADFLVLRLGLTIE
tara:strand:+ start:18 stop:506 length:489 start_codon:yes stop_codon:yes gene_type:complete